MKHSYVWLPRKYDYQTDRRADWQTPAKVIPMCRYDSQATQQLIWVYFGWIKRPRLIRMGYNQVFLSSGRSKHRCVCCRHTSSVRRIFHFIFTNFMTSWLKPGVMVTKTSLNVILGDNSMALWLITPPNTWFCPTLIGHGTSMCSNVETNLSWTCLVSGLLSSEYPSVLFFRLRPWSNIVKHGLYFYTLDALRLY